MIYDELSETAAYIRSRCALKPRVGVILGSGLGSFAGVVKQEWSQEYSQIPHFGSPSVEGHKGALVLGHLGEIPVALLCGRLHLYEGYTMPQVVFPARTLAMLGIEALVVTNAAGGLSKKMKPGDFMVITDHINLTGDNPLKGRNMDQIGPRFPDLSEAYDREFVRLAVACAKEQKLRYCTGIYAGLAGPTYETPAEVRYLQTIGANAVGMSTVPEVIAANHFGVRVCGVSCITNLASGISKVKLSHAEVTSVAKNVEEKFKDYLTALVTKIARNLDESHRQGR